MNLPTSETPKPSSICIRSFCSSDCRFCFIRSSINFCSTALNELFLAKLRSEIGYQIRCTCTHLDKKELVVVVSLVFLEDWNWKWELESLRSWKELHCSWLVDKNWVGIEGLHN